MILFRNATEPLIGVPLDVTAAPSQDRIPEFLSQRHIGFRLRWKGDKQKESSNFLHL